MLRTLSEGEGKAGIVLLLAGVVYVAAIRFGPTLLARMGLLAESSGALTVALDLLLLRLPACLMIAIAVSVSARLRSALRPRVPALLGAVLISGVVSYALSMFRLWPWVWQWPNAPGFAFAQTIVGQEQVAAAAVYLLGWGIVSPVIEEVLFRGALLNWLALVLPGRSLPVVLGAIVFSATHFLWSPPTTRYQIMHGAFLVAFGAVLGWIATEPKLGLPTAIGAHAGRNIVEISTSFVAAARL